MLFVNFTHSMRVAAVLIVALAATCSAQIQTSKPSVLVGYSVLPYDIVRDNYGHNVSGKYICLDVSVYNATDDQQLIIKAFMFKSMNNVGDPDVNIDSDLVKGSIVKGQELGVRNRALFFMRMVGGVATSSTVFFKSAGPKATFTQGVDIFNDPFQKGYEAIFPDTTVKYLANWDKDDVFKSGFVVDAGASARGRIFMPLKSVCAAIVDPKSKCSEGGLVHRPKYNEAEVKKALGTIIPFGVQAQVTHRQKIQSAEVPNP